MRRSTIFIAALTFILLGSCRRPENSVAAPQAKQRDGAAVTVGPEAGKITLVHFWATWCGPCRMELPSFVEFARTNEGSKLRWVAVANDPSFDVVDEHLRRDGVTMETLLDPRGATLQSWKIQAIPTTIVLDGQGNELARYVGAQNWNDRRRQDAVLRFTP